MRMLKKLLLAGAFIGVLGSFGFAQEAKAATTVTPSGDHDNKITIKSDIVSANSVVVEADSVEIFTSNATTLSTDGIPVDIKTSVNADGSKVTANEVSSLTIKILDKDKKELYSGPYNMSSKLYKIKAEASGDEVSNGGTVKLGDKTAAASVHVYGYTDDVFTISATADGAFKFASWTPAVSGGSVKVGTSSASYVASFTRLAPDSITLCASVRGMKYESAVVAYTNEPITFSYTADPKKYTTTSLKITYSDNGYISGSDWTRTPIKTTDSIGYLTATLTAVYKVDGVDYELSDDIDIVIEEGTGTSTKVNLTGIGDKEEFKNYITEGHTLAFKAKAENGSTDMSVEVTEGKDYYDNISVEKNSSDKNCTIKIKFKEEKLDKGNSKANFKFKIKVSGVFANIDGTSDSSNEKEVEVYGSRPTNSYDTTNGMKYTVPAKVNTGTDQPSDDSDTYKKVAFKTEGIRLNVLLDGNVIGTTTTASTKGVSSAVDAGTMDTIVTNLGKNGKITNNCTIGLRAYPCDSNGNCNKLISNDTSVEVRKVVVKLSSSSSASNGGSASASAYDLPLAIVAPADKLVAAARNTTTTSTSTATETERTYVAYGIVGRSVKWPDDFVEEKTRTAVADKDKTATINGIPNPSLTVKSSDSENTYSGVAGVRSTDNSGLDKVPKTGQSNVFVYVMAVVVCGAVGYGLYVYNKKSKKSI